VLWAVMCAWGAGWVGATPFVITGDPAPGAAPGEVFGTFEDPRLNMSGEIAFGARLTTGSDDGVWYTTGGQVLQPALAIEDHPEPGGGTFGPVQRSSVRLNDAGHAAFMARVGSLDSYWSTRTGSVATIVSEGDPAPGSTPPANFSALNSSRFHLNNSNHIAFIDSTLDGVWSETTGSIQLVAGAGNPGPGGISIDNIPVLEYNDNGHCAMRVDENLLNNNYILSDRTGSLQKVAGAGDGAPGGGTYPVGGRPMGTVRFNNSGRIAFEADVEQLIGGVTTLRHGIFVEDAGGTLHLVCKEQTPLPDGTVPTEQTALQVLALDDQGLCFYHAGATAAQRNLYVYDTNTNTNSLLIQAGAASAPGTTSPFDTFNPSVKTNAAGILAFRARLADGNDGFWIEQTPGAGDYQLIVLEGQSVEVAPGDIREIDAIDLNYTQFFNDSGQYSYSVDFTDDSEAIFLGAQTADDEPPVADANGPYTYVGGSLSIILDGTGSSDPDGDPITDYDWLVSAATALSGPTPSVTFAQTGITAQTGLGSSVDVELVVTANGLQSDPSTTTISYQGVDPVVNAFDAAADTTSVFFTGLVTDLDLEYNALIADFEIATLEIDFTQALVAGDVGDSEIWNLIVQGNSASTTIPINETFPLWMFPPGTNTVWLNVADLGPTPSIASVSVTFFNVIPEPGTLALLFLGGLGLWSRRRKC
jgi:hypothetical protein